MRDYKAFNSYKATEWENDIIWKGKRLSFLWNMRDYYTDIYNKNGLATEKNTFYSDCQNNEINSIAQHEYCYKKSDIRNWDNWSDEAILQNWIRLNKLKNNNKKEFLKKSNCYLYEYITDHRDQLIYEHGQ